MEVRDIWVEELGGIQSKWHRGEDGIARRLGSASECDEEIRARGRRVVACARKRREVEKQWHAKYPGKQIFQGPLPDYDVEWEGEEGGYMYLLKPRRRNGLFQILEAIPLEAPNAN